MNANPQVIDCLNEYLSFELTGYKQYLLHGSMCRHWGYSRLAQIQHDYSDEETRHAKNVIARILLLGATPLMKDLRDVVAQESVERQLEKDHDLVGAAIVHLRAAIGTCERNGDFVSRDLLCVMLDDEELHLDWLDRQRLLIAKIGVQNYLQAQL